MSTLPQKHREIKIKNVIGEKDGIIFISIGKAVVKSSTTTTTKWKGAPEWRKWLGVQLLVSAGLVVSGWWDRAPHPAPSWAASA